MRYPDGGGLIAEERARRERVRLAAAECTSVRPPGAGRISAGRCLRIAEVVRTRFGADYTLPGLALLLHRLGGSMQVPARRADVLDQLANERRSVSEGASEYGQPFLGLARDWRRLPFRPRPTRSSPTAARRR
jgi:hypothetical protein